VNDIPLQQTGSCDAGQFADDVSMWTSARKKRTALYRLQLALQLLEPWLKMWRVKLNVAKTQLTCFGQLATDGTITLLGQQVTEKKSIKILGMNCDQRRSMTLHCREKAMAGARRVALLRRLHGHSWGANKGKLLMFYKQFIRPVMETGYIATANACASAKTLLQRVQNSALRAIYRPPPRTRMKDLHARAGLIEISERLQHLRERAITRYENSSLISRMNDKVTIIAPRPIPIHDS